MFSKLFKKNKKVKEVNKRDDTYSLSEMKEDGKTFLLRFKNNQWKFAESGKYPFQMGIAIPLHSNNNGFPTKEENEQLLNMEEILLHEFEKNDVAIFVGAITGGGMKEFVLYTGKPQEASKVFETLRDEIKHHEVQCIIRDDPQWEVYKTYGPRMKN